MSFPDFNNNTFTDVADLQVLCSKECAFQHCVLWSVRVEPRLERSQKKEKPILLTDRLGCPRVDWMDSNLRSGLCLCQSHGRGDLRDDAISKT